MANFSKKTHGENATKGVDLVVSVYDKGHWSKDADKDGKPFVDKEGNPFTREGVYVQQTLHPDSPLAAGQQFLGLKSVDAGEGRVNKNENLYKSQFEQVVAAAGDNVSDLKDKDGNVVGKNYGVKADIMFKGETGSRYALMNTKTLAPSELSVAEIGDRTINDRVFEVQAEAKAAKAAAKEAAAKEAPVAEAQVEAETPAIENDQPEL